MNALTTFHILQTRQFLNYIVSLRKSCKFSASLGLDFSWIKNFPMVRFFYIVFVLPPCHFTLKQKFVFILISITGYYLT